MKLLVALLLLSAAAPVLGARVELGASVESAAPGAPAVAAPTSIAPLGSAPLAPTLTLSAAPSASLSAPAALAPAAAAPAPLAPAAAPVAADAPSAAAVPAAAADEAPAVAAPAADAARSAAAPGAAPASRPADGLRDQLARLAVGLDEASRPGAAADAPQNALQTFWDFVRDRHPAPTQDVLARRLDAGRNFLLESLRDPAISARVAFALRSQSAIAPGMNLPQKEILTRLRAALTGGRVIRVASPNEGRSLGPRTAAAAVTLPNGRTEIRVQPDSSVLTRAPPALLAAILLHELVHAEFGLGEYAAYVVETAYYLQLTRLVPELARDPDAAFNETVRHDVLHGELAGMIAENYGDKLLGNPDDVAALEKDASRRRRRVAAAIDDIAALDKSGRWDAMPDKAEWLQNRLPREDDRRYYFALMNAEIARLPDGAPFSAVFAGAAAALRGAAPPARAPLPKIRAHLDSVAPRTFGRRGLAPAAPRADAAVPLDGLRTAGFAALPPYSLLDRETESAALAEVDSRYAPDGQPWSSFLELAQPPSMHSAGETRWDDAKHPELNALLRPFVERLTAEINRALPGENVKVRDVQLRLETKARPADVGIHVDLGGYVTATYSLRGDGTDLYLTAPDGAVRAIRGPPHTTAVVTNKEREWAARVPGTVHAAPALGLGQMRVVLIVRYYRPGYEGTDMPQDVSRRLDDALKARSQRVRLALERRAPPASSGGLLDRLRGALR